MEPQRNSPLEQAVAEEVRALAARKSMTHKEIQEKTGINKRSFSRYFVECNRDIPMAVVIQVAHALGVSPSELIRAAEESLRDDTDEEPAPVLGVKRAAARRIPTTVRQPRIVD